MMDGNEKPCSDHAGIEVEVHELYKDLAERSGQSLEEAHFSLMKDVFMWAVDEGVQAGTKRTLAAGKTQPFHWTQLSQELDIPILKAVAVADSEDVEILLHKDKILRIAEEFANAGVRLIKQELIDQPRQPLWNLVNIAKGGSHIN